MQNKIEVDILLFILIEAVFLLFFFKESFLTIIIGIILGIFLIIITKNIKNNKYTNFLLLTLSIPISFIIFLKTINFISYNILKHYSIIITIIPFLFISLYLAFKKYHTFIKSVELSFYFFLFIKIIAFLLIIPNINTKNFDSLLDLSINYKFIYITFFILYLYKIINYLTNYFLNKKRIIITFINPLLIKILTILSLGNILCNIYKYPYIKYLQTIRYFDFIERIDGILAFEYLFDFFYLFSFILLSIKFLFKKQFNI